MSGLHRRISASLLQEFANTLREKALDDCMYAQTHCTLGGQSHFEYRGKAMGKRSAANDLETLIRTIKPTE